MSDTTEALMTLIHNTFGIDRSTLEADKPLAAYGLDSLALAELLFAVEDHYGINYPEDRTGVQTLAELADVVDACRSQALTPAGAAA